jgi:hypothetical protein
MLSTIVPIENNVRKIGIDIEDAFGIRGAGAWPTNCLTDLSACIGELEADGHMGPYAAVLRSTWAAKLRALVSNTATK